ncbi:MAG: glycosyltransferase family 52 [Lachnospiraceae bacterium]
MKNRIYVCHTYYHVYVTFLKELSLPIDERGHATLVLSSMSNDFESFASRAEESGLFEAVYQYDEKPYTFFGELAKYKKDRGNIVLNMWNRMIFCRKLGAFQEEYIPVDFKAYKDIYVYCDSDSIGYYLTYRRIKYHALEDGLNCLAYYDTARYDNRGAFKLKAFLSKKLNLIFIQNGYGKYCIDMEVNSIEAIKCSCPYYKEVKRSDYVEKLTSEGKKIILKTFIKDYDTLIEQLEKANATKKARVLLLTEPLCDLETRARIFHDIIERYCQDATVVIKQHPRDLLDYSKEFGEYLRIDKSVPMEMLNFIPNVYFEKVISVLTETEAILFAKELLRLGPDFMDEYEDPEVHRQNEKI